MSFHWLTYSWTGGFELVTCEFELTTRGFKILLITFTLFSIMFLFLLLEKDYIKQNQKAKTKPEWNGMQPKQYTLFKYL